MVQLFVRADRTYCVEVPAGASVAEFLETFEDVSGAAALTSRTACFVSLQAASQRAAPPACA